MFQVAFKGLKCCFWLRKCIGANKCLLLSKNIIYVFLVMPKHILYLILDERIWIIAFD